MKNRRDRRDRASSPTSGNLQQTGPDSAPPKAVGIAVSKDCVEAFMPAVPGQVEQAFMPAVSGTSRTALAAEGRVSGYTNVEQV
jgi:hypothetical protein